MTEKRRFKRLAIKLDLSFLKSGDSVDKFRTGCTVDVSPAGLYFETACDDLKIGNLLKLELTIPPTEGLLEMGGRISGFAKVLRKQGVDICKSHLFCARYGLAVQFCESLKFCS